MKKVLAFAGSNSSTSINKQLVSYVTSLLDNVQVTLIDLNDFEMPLYSSDRENNSGFPKLAEDFVQLIRESDGLVVSLAEYNGAYTSAFKNIFDWASRVEQNTFLEKPMLLMATSPGGRGGASVLEMAADRFPRHGANVTATFSLPGFYQNFENKAISNSELDSDLKQKVSQFETAL